MVKDKNKRLELMSPAGSFESLQAAVDNGADSIYFGIDQLNMRARSTINFELDDLPKISSICSDKNIRTYLTANTIIYNHDLSIIKKILSEAKKHHISAIIASDQAVISMAQEIGLSIHVSTQMNVTNTETIKFYSHFVDTIVLSRELSLRQISAIVKDIERLKIKGPSGELIKIEIFGHGALCMAISGKCYLSLHAHNSSANRGACKQNCRKKYTVIDQESGFEIEIDNEYMMSPKDLCTIDLLDQIIESGVQILKIEGRGRAADYVATTTKVYREAIDSYYNGYYTQEYVKKWIGELRKVYNRDFWSGYYLGQKLGEWSDEPGSHATQKKVYVGKGKHYFPKTNIAEFLIEAYGIKKNDRLMVIGPTTGVKEFVLNDMYVNDREKNEALKGDSITTSLSFRIRPSDKLYKIVETS